MGFGSCCCGRRRKRRRRHSHDHRTAQQHPPHHGLSVVQTIDIDAPLDVVWQVMINVAEYPNVMRDTTHIQPLENTNASTRNLGVVDYSRISKGAKFRQYFNLASSSSSTTTRGRSSNCWCTKQQHEFDFTITHAGPVNDSDDNVRAKASATQHRGGDFTAAQTAERIRIVDDANNVDNNNHDDTADSTTGGGATTRSMTKERTRFYVTLAYLPYTVRGYLLTSCGLFRRPLVVQGNTVARNICQDVKAAAEQLQGRNANDNVAKATANTGTTTRLGEEEEDPITTTNESTAEKVVDN